MFESVSNGMNAVLANLLEASWINDANDWALAHSSEILVMGVALLAFLAFLLVIWRVGRMPTAQDAQLRAAFEKRLGLSREDLAEVGLPILVPDHEPTLSALHPPASLNELTLDQLMVVARYCMWKGDAEGAREAIAPIMSRGDAEARRAVLALLEGR